MLRSIRFLGLIVVSVFAVACAPQATPPASVSIVPTTDSAQVAQTSDTAEVAQTISNKAQFLNSYAVWCTTCRHNEPFISSLKATFADSIEVVTLDIDDPTTKPTRDKFALIDRSIYLLVAPDGETVLARWFGVLNEQEVTARLAQYAQTGQ